MKKILLPLTACLLLFSCVDKKAQEKALRDSVITIHEKVMGEDEKVMSNQNALSTFIKNNPGTPLKDSANFYLTRLTLADTTMMLWMHNFAFDISNKPHDETMAYLNKQKKMITQIDSQMNVVISTSGKFITKIKTK